MSERAPEKLTGREQEVAALMAKGLTNAEIAERLGVSFATAKWYASQVLTKLEIDSRGQVGPQQGIGLARKHRALWPLGLLGKPLAIAAAVVPIGGLAVFAGLVFASREGDTASQPRSYQSPSAIARGAAAQPPAPSINTPAKQPQGCDWAAGQGHINDGPLDHSGCDFSGVDFGERGIMWNMADLHGANLSSAIIAGTFANADFSGADLRGVRFVQSVFGRTNFSGADLTGANFTDSILTDGDFTGGRTRAGG